MKIIYVHQHFVTSQGTSGTRSYDVSQHLINMGHEITMVCGLHDQSSLAKMPWYRWFRTETIDGIKVVACNVRYSNSQGVLARMWSFFTFAFLSTLACLREREADLIFATSTPLTVGIPGRIASTLLRIPYIFEVRDLWPEDLVAAGRMKPGLQCKVWEWLEAFSYGKAKQILVVSEGFRKRLIERGFAPDYVKTILLGADAGVYRDIEPDHEFVSKHGLDGKVVAIYAGAHGDANGLTQVLDAAQKLLHREDIAIVLIGDGKMKPSLRQSVEDRHLKNVHMLDPVSKTQLPGVLSACHIGLMILKQITRPRWVTPNKVFDYMFAGLPTIVNFPGTTAELVEAEGVGVASKPACGEDLAAKIEHWADHPEERTRIGQHARQLGFDKFDRKRIAEQLAEVFEEVVGKNDRQSRQARLRTALGPENQS
jgi:glycosyltransferase involved in cell wall biosynthesis